MNNFVNCKGDTKLLLQIVFYGGLYEFYFIYFLFELTDFFKIQTYDWFFTAWQILSVEIEASFVWKGARSIY